MYIYTKGEQVATPTIEERSEASDRLGYLAAGTVLQHTPQDGEAFWTLARAMGGNAVLDWECDDIARFPGPKVVAGALPEHAAIWGIAHKTHTTPQSVLRPEVRFGFFSGRFISDVYGSVARDAKQPLLHIELPMLQGEADRPIGWQPFSVDMGAMRRSLHTHGSNFRYDSYSVGFGKHVSRLAKLFKQMEQETFV